MPGFLPVVILGGMSIVFWHCAADGCWHTLLIYRCGNEHDACVESTSATDPFYEEHRQALLRALAARQSS